MNRTTPVIRFQGLPFVLRNSGSPEPFGAVFISLRASFGHLGPHRDLAGLLRLRRVHPPHHPPLGLLDVVGRDPGQLAERPQARVDRREEEVPKALLGRLVERLLVLRAERLQPRLRRGLLEPLERIGDAVHLLGPVEGRQHDRDHAPVRRRAAPRRVALHPLSGCAPS